LIAFYGAHGIFYELPRRVSLFTKFFLVSLIYYIVVSIVEVIVLSIAAANYKKACEEKYPEYKDQCPYNFDFLRWGASLAVGVVIDVSI
jgi:hypothetical protein